METLDNIVLNRTRDRAFKILQDAINKLKGIKQLVTLGFPDAPAEEALARGADSKQLYKRNVANDDWIRVADEENITEIIDIESINFTIPIVSVLPTIPDDPSMVFYQGQIWGSGPGLDRWYPMMRFTLETGVP